MRYLFLFALPLLLIACQQAKILIVADEWPQMDTLATRLGEQRDYEIQKIEQDQLGYDLSAFDFVFMYVHKTLLTEAEKALMHFTETGGSLIVLHHGIASSKMNNPQWLAFLGIELFPRDHPQYPWGVLAHTTHTMVNLYPGHFITSNGIQYEKEVLFRSEYDNLYHGSYLAFDLMDTEIFLNQRIKDKQINVLFGVTDAAGSRMQPTSGWYKQSGKGWIYYYQAGHSAADFNHPNFLRVLMNTLEWKAD